MFRPKTTGYVSDVTLMLREFDKTHQKSASQLAEINKYQRIHHLRDDPTASGEKSDIWEGF